MASASKTFKLRLRLAVISGLRPAASGTIDCPEWASDNFPVGFAALVHDSALGLCGPRFFRSNGLEQLQGMGQGNVGDLCGFDALCTGWVWMLCMQDQVGAFHGAAANSSSKQISAQPLAHSGAQVAGRFACQIQVEFSLAFDLFIRLTSGNLEALASVVALVAHLHSGSATKSAGIMDGIQKTSAT